MVVAVRSCRCNVYLSYPLCHLSVAAQEVLQIFEQQPDKPTLYAAFERLSASLVDAAEKDTALGCLVRAGDFGGAVLQLPWSGGFSRVSFGGVREKPKAAEVATSGRLLRVYVEFSDFAEAAAASGSTWSPAAWRGLVTGVSEAAGSSSDEASCSAAASDASVDTRWELAKDRIRHCRVKGAVIAAATRMSSASPPDSSCDCLVGRALPSELIAALQLWSGRHTVKQGQQAESLRRHPCDPLQFYGV